MRSLSIGLLIGLLGTSAVSSAAEAELKRIHPGDTALSQDKNGKWQYKSFPQLGALYTSVKDTTRDKSNCDRDCSQAWPPLVPTQHNVGQQVGDWTVISREDGRKQWSYKGQPVYLRFHNMPASNVEMKDDGFRYLEP